MRTYPKEEYDFKEMKKLEAPVWMQEVLKKNPDYPHWGNYEDYMSDKRGGWGDPCELESVSQLWELDDYNELVHFYFVIVRDNKRCEVCDGEGYNPETLELSKTWYDFGRDGKGWGRNITQDEVDALWEKGRLKGNFKEKPTAEEVNVWSRKGFGHDSINKWICVQVRAERLGVYGHCDVCNGEGYLFTEPKPHLALQMWFLHPRKGASRGVFLKNIEEHELPRVIEYLKEARDRNAERFSKL